MKASVAFVTLVAVLAAVSSLAQPPDGQMGPGMRMMRGPMRMMVPLEAEFPVRNQSPYTRKNRLWAVCCSSIRDCRSVKHFV